MKSWSLSMRGKIIGQFLFVIAVFVSVIFFWMLPALKKAVFTEKETQIRHLTQSAASLLEEYYVREQKGELTREEAQKQALVAVKGLRYGPEGKDYFWINDFHPKMIMHPYRSDLDGKDITNFKDPKNKHLFVEFAKVCKDKGEGFVDYMWQWKDDKTKIVPKLSFVKAFTPWGWIIGTGIYVNDVGEQVAGMRNALLIVIVPVVILLLGILYIPMRQLGSLNQVANGLQRAAEEVNSAASQVSSSSQQLAQGASQQAASLEESSASIEELASMTRRNAESAKEANQMMQGTTKVVDQATKTMESTQQSMEAISNASTDIAKIIKTIDEIAFQTNLLALNAAVEAARAGEAGAGFAVVADEVRNLAMRAAEAAKNTSQLIDDTVKRIGVGADLVHQSVDAFQEVAKSAQRVAHLVEEIAAASEEQAQGLGQISQVVSQMDQTVQATAANAEEAAATSEELSAQSVSMQKFVQQLEKVIGGMRDHHATLVSGSGGEKKVVQRLAGLRHGAARPAPEQKMLASEPKGHGVAPEKVIPLEEGDFKDF
ncbi:MAG: methyl-accepting chemotaxis protein [Thermodesulfobacteriota bacterium]